MQTEMSRAEDEARAIRLVCQAAQLVLENGGEVYRVEETGLRMAKGFGLNDVNIVGYPTAIFVDACGHTRVRRITHRGSNTTRLAMINDVSRRVEHGDMSLDEAEAALSDIAQGYAKSKTALALSYGVSAAGFALLFGGTPGALLAAFLIGMIVQMVQPLFSKMAMGSLFGNFSGGLITAVLAEAGALILPYGNVNSVIVGGIMPMLTGLLMTTAVRDTMYGDLVSGVIRAVEALLLAGSVALGVYVGLKIAAMMGGVLL